MGPSLRQLNSTLSNYHLFFRSLYNDSLPTVGQATSQFQQITATVTDVNERGSSFLNRIEYYEKFVFSMLCLCVVCCRSPFFFRSSVSLIISVFSHRWRYVITFIILILSGTLWLTSFLGGASKSQACFNMSVPLFFSSLLPPSFAFLPSFSCYLFFSTWVIGFFVLAFFWCMFAFFVPATIWASDTCVYVDGMQTHYADL
jgi:hypothetical protein